MSKTKEPSKWALLFIAVLLAFLISVHAYDLFSPLI